MKAPPGTGRVVIELYATEEATAKLCEVVRKMLEAGDPELAKNLDVASAWRAWSADVDGVRALARARYKEE